VIYRGKAHRFGDNVNTDDIIPARYLHTTDRAILAAHCMEHMDKNFSRKVRRGDVVVAGRNFGCGSSREHAPISIKASGVSCVVAETFARIFFRNSINIGLPVVEDAAIARRVRRGDSLAIDLANGKIRNLTRRETYKVEKYPPFMRRIINSGGLMNYIKKRAKR
jgi:3-isopropylmalate/(R)-2-methylmalate dehydratase small subunit